MKEYLVCSDKFESVKLLDVGEDQWKLKTERLDWKKEEKNTSKPINLDKAKLKAFEKVLNDLFPVTEVDPLSIPIEPIKMIADSEGTISLGQLANYLEFNNVQEMVDLLPDNIRVLKIGNNISQAVIKVSELNKASAMTDLKTIKTQPEMLKMNMGV